MTGLVNNDLISRLRHWPYVRQKFFVDDGELSCCKDVQEVKMA
jgi:hypothetical protein